MIAEKLRKLADGMDKDIQAKRHPAIAGQNMTPRRIRIAQGVAKDADRLELVQAVLRRLATAHADDDWNALERALGSAEDLGPGIGLVQSLRSRAEVQRLPTQVLKNLAVGFAPPPDPKAAIRRMEQDLVGLRIPGFFPTPMDTGRQMAQLADLRPGQRVLEPSAGKGDLAEAILETEPGVTLEVCEISHRLRDILAAKGLTVRTEYDCLDITDQFDRVVMNPPFEDGLDMQHTRRMFERLAPGGLLVGIVSQGPFFRSDKVSVAFREWLKDKLVEEELLPSGTFEGAASFRQTGVASRIVVLKKRA